MKKTEGQKLADEMEALIKSTNKTPVRVQFDSAQIVIKSQADKKVLFALSITDPELRRKVAVIARELL